MKAVAESGWNPVSKPHIQPTSSLSGENKQADAGLDGRTYLARPRSQAGTGTGEKSFCPCSADHEQDWQSYPVDSRYAESADYIYILETIMTISRCVCTFLCGNILA